MTLVVGHNCPGCGLDTPAVACVACGGGVVWDRAHGSHCGVCGLSASTITCAECGLRAELDKRADEPLVSPVAPRDDQADMNETRRDDTRDTDRAARLPGLIAWAGAVRSSSPTMRVVAIVLSLGLPASVAVLLASGRDGAGAAGGVTVVDAGPLARRSAAKAIESQPGAVAGTTLLPVPVQPPPADTSPPYPHPRAALPPPPPTVYVPPPPPPPVAQAPRLDGWLQRMLRSGRTQPSGPFEKINGDGGGR